MKYIIYDTKNVTYVKDMLEDGAYKTKGFKTMYAANKFIAQRLRSNYENYKVECLAEVKTIKVEELK